jgi:predicted acyltransferase
LGISWFGYQVDHAEWEGFHFYDLIFPLFLFIVGVVIPFSLSRYTTSGASKAQAYRRITKRAIVLILLGFVYWGILQFNFSSFRWPGVLQRIGICYFFASVAVLHLRIRGQAILLAGLLLLYWAILLFIPAPGRTAGDLTMEGNLAGYIDRQLIPGTYCCYHYGDNEGLLSTIPALGTALLGVLTGHWLRSGKSRENILLGLLGGGAGCLIIGYLWWPVFPVIKNIWTSSYVMIAGGWSLLLLAAFYYIIELKQWKKWAFFFIVIGMNPITIYMMSTFVSFGAMGEFFLGGVAKLLPGLHDVVITIGTIACEWLVLYYFYKKGTFLRV